jgi:hypothetical protein
MKTAIIALCLSLTAATAFAAQVPPPLAIPNSALGGAALNQYTPGTTDGKGAHNIGLLVKCWGKVTKTDPAGKFFYIDDGSKLRDGYSEAFVGIRVSIENLAPGNTISMPGEGQFLLITGISSTSAIQVTNDQGQQVTKIIPTLRPRKQDDLYTVSLSQ